MAHHCRGAGCTKGWSPTRKCHCSLCGHNFTTVTNFDKHQDRGEQIVCDPVKAGLVLNGRGQWSQPGEVDVVERFQAASKPIR